MIVLNVRIEAIDSGCTYQVISEAQKVYVLGVWRRCRAWSSSKVQISNFEIFFQWG